MSRADLQRVGKAGDGGIDGVISLDRLGLEQVYVQAKRWQSLVGRPEVQGFCGALAGQRAGKGVITTLTFIPQAVEFARSVEGIVLVDGRRLAELMINHAAGSDRHVASRHLYRAWIYGRQASSRVGAGSPRRRRGSRNS